MIMICSNLTLTFLFDRLQLSIIPKGSSYYVVPLPYPCTLAVLLMQLLVALTLSLYMLLLQVRCVTYSLGYFKFLNMALSVLCNIRREYFDGYTYMCFLPKSTACLASNLHPSVAIDIGAIVPGALQTYGAQANFNVWSIRNSANVNNSRF